MISPVASAAGGGGRGVLGASISSSSSSGSSPSSSSSSVSTTKMPTGLKITLNTNLTRFEKVKLTPELVGLTSVDQHKLVLFNPRIALNSLMVNAASTNSISSRVKSSIGYKEKDGSGKLVDKYKEVKRQFFSDHLFKELNHEIEQSIMYKQKPITDYNTALKAGNVYNNIIITLDTLIGPNNRVVIGGYPYTVYSYEMLNTQQLQPTQVTVVNNRSSNIQQLLYEFFTRRQYFNLFNLFFTSKYDFDSFKTRILNKFKIISCTSFIDALNKAKNGKDKLDQTQLSDLLKRILNNDQSIDSIINNWSKLVEELNTNIIILTDADTSDFSKQTDKLSIIPEDSFKLSTVSPSSSGTPRANNRRNVPNKDNIVLYYDSSTQKFYLLEYNSVSIFKFNETPHFIVLLLFLYYHKISPTSTSAFLYQDLSDKYNNSIIQSNFNRYATDILDISSQTVYAQQPVDVLDIAVNIDLYPGDAIPLAKRPVLACNNRWDTIVSSWRKIWGQDPRRTTVPNSYSHVSSSIGQRPYYESSRYGYGYKNTPTGFGSSRTFNSRFPGFNRNTSYSSGSTTTSSSFNSRGKYGGTRKIRAHKKSMRIQKQKRSITRTKNLRQK